MKNTPIDRLKLPEDSSSMGNLVEVNVEVAESVFIHSHSREGSNMMLEEEPRDTFEPAKDEVDNVPEEIRSWQRRSDQPTLSQFL